MLSSMAQAQGVGQHPLAIEQAALNQLAAGLIFPDEKHASHMGSNRLNIDTVFAMQIRCQSQKEEPEQALRCDAAPLSSGRACSKFTRDKEARRKQAGAQLKQTSSKPRKLL
jgi:hypothetical protein